MAIEIVKVVTSAILFISMVVINNVAGVEQTILASIMVFSISFFGDFFVVVKSSPAFNDAPTNFSKIFGTIGCVFSIVVCLFVFMCIAGALNFEIIFREQQPVFMLSSAEGSMIRIPQVNITILFLFYFTLPTLLHALFLVRAVVLRKKSPRFANNS